VLAKIAATIARGLQLRFEQGNHAPVNIIACENMVRGTSQLKQAVLAELPAQYHALLEQYVGFVDSAVDRIVPDCIRALLAEQPIDIRSPGAIRPWQHVLEPLSGYLVLAEQQYADAAGALASGFNFGPESSGAVPVGELAAGIVRHWGQGQLNISGDPHKLHEAGTLKLDISKARVRLGWRPRWDFDKTLHHTVDWYRRVLCHGESARQVCLAQIADYQTLAQP
jgi:CDP-glucose 4,6-dehydratase